MSQLRQRAEELKALNVAVAIVTFQRSPIAVNYARETGLEWPLLVDEELELYKAYGMEKGRIRDVWGPATIAEYFKLFAKGRMLRKPAGDVNQLGGDVLIDPEGIVRLHHVGSGPADRPAVEALVEVVRGAEKKA